jgi:FtsZ-binding cell division protein ZapB
LNCEQLVQRVVQLEHKLLTATERIAILEVENTRLREKNAGLQQQLAS